MAENRVIVTRIWKWELGNEYWNYVPGSGYTNDYY